MACSALLRWIRLPQTRTSSPLKLFAVPLPANCGLYPIKQLKVARKLRHISQLQTRGLEFADQMSKARLSYRKQRTVLFLLASMASNISEVALICAFVSLGQLTRVPTGYKWDSKIENSTPLVSLLGSSSCHFCVQQLWCGWMSGWRPSALNLKPQLCRMLILRTASNIWKYACIVFWRRMRFLNKELTKWKKENWHAR